MSHKREDMKLRFPEPDKDGKLPAYAWPGGYPLIYFDRENSVLCAECATKSLNDSGEVPQFRPEDVHVYYEGPSLFCDQCNKEIESAYGDLDASEGK